MRPRLYRHEKGKNKQGSRARGGEERAIAGAVRRLKKLTGTTFNRRGNRLKIAAFFARVLILIHWQQQENKICTFNRSYR